MTQHRDTLKLGDELDAGLDRASGADDLITLRGRVELELTRADGTVERELVDNLITTVGRNIITDQLLAAPAAGGKPTHMAVGTGTVAPAVGDTALGVESARVALTSKTRSGNVLTMVGDYAAGTATATLTEAGTFDAATAGQMSARATFGGIAKGANDTLKITWTWTIG